MLQLRDEIKTFILAGHETSASMMAWLTYELIRNPDKQQQFLANARDVLGSGRGKGSSAVEQFRNATLPDRKELNRLTYVLNSLKVGAGPSCCVIVRV